MVVEHVNESPWMVVALLRNNNIPEYRWPHEKRGISIKQLLFFGTQIEVNLKKLKLINLSFFCRIQ